MDKFKVEIAFVVLGMLLAGVAISLAWSPSLMVIYGLKAVAKRKPNLDWNTNIATYILQGAIFKGAIASLLLPTLFYLVDNKTAWKLIEIYPLVISIILFPLIWFLEPILFVIKKGPILNAAYGIFQMVFVWTVCCFIFFVSQQ